VRGFTFLSVPRYTSGAKQVHFGATATAAATQNCQGILQDNPGKPVPECPHSGFLFELRMTEAVATTGAIRPCKALGQIVATNK